MQDVQETQELFKDKISLEQIDEDDETNKSFRGEQQNVHLLGFPHQPVLSESMRSKATVASSVKKNKHRRNQSNVHLPDQVVE